MTATTAGVIVHCLGCGALLYVLALGTDLSPTRSDTCTNCGLVSSTTMAAGQQAGTGTVTVTGVLQVQRRVQWDRSS